MFSSTSTSYTAVTNQGVEICVKQTPFAQDEMHGAELAATYFPRVMKPRLAPKGELVYPLFRGITKSDARLSYIQSGYKDQQLAQRLLHAEIVQAEDTLRAYRQSLSLTTTSNDRADGQRRNKIQQFFHDRLADDSWMRLYYGEGVKLRNADRPIPFEELLLLRWRVNGKCYGTLKDAFKYAHGVVTPGSPYLDACPVAFGLGRGNLMLSEAFKEKGGSGEVLFTDLETSGIHPVMLDLATPLYVDTMFEPLFHNLLGPEIHPGVRYSFANGEIIVHLSRQVDVLTQAILRIKNHFLIKPLCGEVRRLGDDLDDEVPLLAVALFLCATVTQNFANDPIGFVENFAAGLGFLRARNFDGIDNCFHGLDFN